MFSERAAEKLRQVAATLLAEAPKGKDQAPPKEPKEAEEQEESKPGTEEKPQRRE
jgi:hypothetical protein